jgi:hypothetical protein
MGLIASVLFVVNVVGALIPGFFPTWMRIEMVGLAAQLAAVGLLVVRGAVDTDAPLTARHWPRVHER